jgi:hypothetical protein
MSFFPKLVVLVTPVQHLDSSCTKQIYRQTLQGPGLARPTISLQSEQIQHVSQSRPVQCQLRANRRLAMTKDLLILNRATRAKSQT